MLKQRAAAETRVTACGARPRPISLAAALIGVIAGSITLLSCTHNAVAPGSGQHSHPASRNSSRQVSGAGPLVLGHGVGLFKVGRLLALDDFENLNNWVVQIEDRPGAEPARVEARNGALDCMVPGRGCTVWFKRKLRTRVTITYDVLCPSHTPAIEGVEPRDINNFWLATDPVDPDRGLFDPRRYSGSFGSYNKMRGYYASTGGGGAGAANLTTRMRRYPREVDGQPAEHLALTGKDGQPDYLISPDKMMSVQLVAYDDVVQYIVDGKLVYQIARGSRIQVESRNSEGDPVTRETVYTLDRFPFYEEGYFGFRMVRTHHIYTNFRVFALDPDLSGVPGTQVRGDTLLQETHPDRSKTE